MIGWRVLDLTDFHGRVTTDRGGLRIGGSRIPVAEVATVLLSDRCVLEGSVMSSLAKHGATMVVCDWRGRPLAASAGWSKNSRVASRHRAQAVLAQPRRKNAWMQLVRAKIHGQASNIASDRVLYRRMRTLAGNVRSGDPANCEAQAARMYWGRMFADRAFTRAPGTSVGANGLLDYGYAVLRSHVVRAVIAAGLIPALGLHHSNRANPYVLADDLIEPFRPAVDWAVRQLDVDAWLSDPGIKAHLVSVLSQHMGHQTIRAEVTSLAQRLGVYVEGKTTTLEVVSWDAPDG